MTWTLALKGWIIVNAALVIALVAADVLRGIWKAHLGRWMAQDVLDTFDRRIEAQRKMLARQKAVDKRRWQEATAREGKSNDAGSAY